MEIIIIATAVGIMAASLIGAFTMHRTVGAFVFHRLPFFVSFSAGVLLFSAFFMTSEALHLLESAVWVGVLVVGGYVASWALARFVPQFHHHHDDSCESSHRSGKRIIIGDGVHNIADGLVLVPAFLASPYLGFGVALSIFIHELLQELSEFFILKQAGYSTAQALGVNFAVSSTILLGVAIGFAFSGTAVLQGALLALSAGFFINLVVHDLLPHHEKLSLKEGVLHTVMIAVGVGLIALVNQVATHSHSHEEDMHTQEHNHDHEIVESEQAHDELIHDEEEHEHEDPEHTHSAEEEHINETSEHTHEHEIGEDDHHHTH